MVYSWEDIKSFRSFLNIFTMKTDLDTLLMPLSDLNIYDKCIIFLKSVMRSVINASTQNPNPPNFKLLVSSLPEYKLYSLF